MATTTLSTILTRLNQRIGDAITGTVTTAINADTNVVCSDLNKEVNQDDAFNRQWIYFTDENNSAEYRKISDYTNSTGTLVVMGASLTDDGADKGSFELHKYDRRNKIRAINQAAREIYPYVFRFLRDRTLITNNLAPNASFEDWSSASYPDHWTSSAGVVISENTTAANVYGSGSSLKLEASADDGYIALHSQIYPKLLDLAGKTITLRAQVLPQLADDAYFSILMGHPDATSTTLTSDPAEHKTYFGLLEFADQEINEDIILLIIRIHVGTNTKYVYVDNFRLLGMDIREYLLPLDFQLPATIVDNIRVQTTAARDYPADDLYSHARFEPVNSWNVSDDATTKYLIIQEQLQSDRHLLIEGHAPLESDLSSATDTMTIEDPQLDCLVELACSKLFEMEAGTPAATDKKFMYQEAVRYRASYEYLVGRYAMKEPSATQKFDWRIL